LLFADGLPYQIGTNLRNCLLSYEIEYSPTKFTKGVSRFLLLYPPTAQNRVFQPFLGIRVENSKIYKFFY